MEKWEPTHIGAPYKQCNNNSNAAPRRKIKSGRPHYIYVPLYNTQRLSRRQPSQQPRLAPDVPRDFSA